MATLKYIEDIQPKIEAGYVYWVILEDGDKIGEYKNENKNSADQSYAELVQELNRYEPGYFNIRLYKYNGKDRGKGGTYNTDYFEFRIHTRNQQGAPAGVSGVDKTIMKELTTTRAELEEYRERERERKMEDTINKAINKAMAGIEGMSAPPEKTEVDKVIEGIERNPEIKQAILTGISRIFGINIAPPVRALGSVETHHTTTTMDEATNKQEALQNAYKLQMKNGQDAFVRLLKIDGAAGDNLLNLAELAEKDPTAYSNGVQFVKMALDSLNKKEPA